MEESNNIFEKKIWGLGSEQLGVGTCSDYLIVNGNLNSQLLTNVNEVSTSLKHCSAQVEKGRSIDSLYSMSTSDVCVLEILGEKEFMEKRIIFDSMQSYYAGCSEKRHSEILKTNCQHAARHWEPVE